jgi:peptidoglycan biosynthesis protein MviN/MurJ (putative lipid II flippase)
VFLLPHFGLVGLAAGVIIGALLHGLIQIPVIWRSGLLPIPAIRGSLGSLVSIARTSIARTLALSASSATILVSTAVLSLVGAGAISLLQFGLTLQAVPVALAGMSISIAAFPLLVKAAAQENLDDLRRHVSRAGSQMLVWSLFLAVIMFVLRHEAAAVLVGVRGGASAFADLPHLVAILTWSVIPMGLVHLATRVWYALGHTRQPLSINGVIEGLKIIIILAAALLVPESMRWALLFVIAWCMPISSWVNVWIHQRRLVRKYQITLISRSIILPAALSGIGMGIVLWFLRATLFSPVIPSGLLPLFLRGGILFILAFVIYLAFLYLFPATRSTGKGILVRLKLIK